MTVLHRVDETFDLPESLPVVALRDLVFFPYMVLPLLIGRPASVRALRAAERDRGYLLLVTQRDGDVDDPQPNDLHPVGTIARILQIAPLTDGTSRVVLEGLGRANALGLTNVDETLFAEVNVREHSRQMASSPDEETAVVRVRAQFAEYVALNDQVPAELHQTLQGVEDASRLGSLMAGHLLVPCTEKQQLLAGEGITEQFRLLSEFLTRELEILSIEEKLDLHVKRQMDTDRRQFYLQEQMKAIKKEMGDKDSEWAEIEQRVNTAVLPTSVRDRTERELRRLTRLNPAAPEASVIRTYLEWILDLPWGNKTEDNLDVGHAGQILDAAHYGLDEVKERVLDHIAVLKLVGELRGPILCLAGPPGVGKTSLGRSIAEALGREFVRMSLGGVRDEAEIRGHRRTYVGALPGRIIQGMRRSGSKNPVFLLDEVDKLARDFHGDPGAALLEVLDPEQNKSFTDHYLELDYDLSEVLFIATANQLSGIPEPLRDRMEIIRIPGYLDTEKRAIAQSFLWPRQAERHGLKPEQVELGDDALSAILDGYTREAGVRELDQRMSRVARKVARHVAERAPADEEPGVVVRVTATDIPEYLGPRPYTRQARESIERAGIANGLAWTAAGGEVLDVEVAVVPGSGQIRLTGTLGDVMKESAFAAMTYARARAEQLGLDDGFHSGVDIHIHLPEGATPKDGPSAGITIAVALISALTGIPTRSDVAMTGEITLRGRVLGVGGLKEKAVAALREGIDTMILPAANATAIERFPDEVRAAIKFHTVETMDEVLGAALSRPPMEAASTPEDPSPEPPLEGYDAGVRISQ